MYVLQMYYTFAMKLWRFLIITGLFCRWRYKYRIVALYRTITCIAFLLHFISFYGFNFYSILSPYIPFHFLCFFSIHFLSFDFILVIYLHLMHSFISLFIISFRVSKFGNRCNSTFFTYVKKF